jgi:hypothetical protein
MGGEFSTYGERKCVYRVLEGTPQGPLGTPRHRWVNNINMNPQEVGCGVMEWIVQAL